MSEYLQKCLDVYENYLRSHFLRIYGIDQNLRYLESQGDIFGLHENKEIHQYVLTLMSEASLAVLEKRQDEIVQLVVQDVKEILDGLFIEEELKQLYEFATSVLGKKLLRNLELFGDSYNKGNLPLSVEMIAQWTDPSLWEKVRIFIASKNVQD